jgi:hypothetical protein
MPPGIRKPTDVPVTRSAVNFKGISTTMPLEAKTRTAEHTPTRRNRHHYPASSGDVNEFPRNDIENLRNAMKVRAAAPSPCNPPEYL